MPSRSRLAAFGSILAALLIAALSIAQVPGKRIPIATHPEARQEAHTDARIVR